jgi:serine/threonine protein kinase/dipeptidyl aminopeptidase/acylaminoacyl peptidase
MIQSDKMVARTPVPKMIGETLRHYRIEAKLGAGGMGVVYRALDTHLDRLVAIKVLPAAAVGDADRRARFAQEAKSASALSHRNIITIYDIDTGQVEGQPVDFIAMQFVAGKTLDRMIGRKGLRLSDALRYAIQIADGLAAAHDAGIVHRDLKPANVIINEQGEVKILDFGLAKLSEPEQPDVFAATQSVHLPSVLQTEAGTIIGTVAYMSPEQAEGHKVDARSDIFSFGAVLYEMITGRRAFPGDSKLSTLASVLQKEPAPVGQAGAPVPRDLERMIARCLRKDPQRRWQSMADIRVALEDLLEDLESGKTEAPEKSGLSRSQYGLPVLIWPALIVIALAAGAYVGSLFLANPPPTFERLTYRRGDVSAARFSPDGQTVLFSAQWADEPINIFSMRAGSREYRPLDLPRSKILSISSIGEMAILLGKGDLGAGDLGTGALGTLARVPLSGGAPREILENVGYADWSPDGTKLAVSHMMAGHHRIEYPIGTILYESAGRPPISLRVSPKGDKLAFFEYDSAIGDYAVILLDLHGKKQVLSRGWRAEANLAWSPKGDEIWFGATKTGDPALRAVNLSGKERLVSQAPAWLAIDDITRDGRVLAAAADSRVGITALPPGAKQERDLSWFDVSYVYDISPDGKTILFAELSYGQGLRNVAIYLRKTDGSPAVRLGEGNQPALSPDGKWVSCIVSEGAQNKLVLLPTGAGEPQKIGATGMHYGRAEWFPDGQKLLFTGNEPNRPVRTFVQHIDGSKPTPITPEGVTASRVSPNQKYVTVASAGKLSVFAIDGGEQKAIANLDADESVIRWSGDGKYLFLRKSEEPSSLKIIRMDTSTGHKETWKELRTPDPVGVHILSVAMTQDGLSYAYSFQRDITTLFVVNGLK